MSVGSRIRHFRQKNHLKQRELGLMIGLSDVSAEVRSTNMSPEQGHRGLMCSKNLLMCFIFHLEH